MFVRVKFLRDIKFEIFEKSSLVVGFVELKLLVCTQVEFYSAMFKVMQGSLGMKNPYLCVMQQVLAINYPASKGE